MGLAFFASHLTKMTRTESRVLIVANEIERGALLEIMARAGTPETRVAYGVAALALLESESFELMLVDSTAGAPAAQFLARARESQSGGTMAALVLTETDEVATRVHLLQAGALDVLTKPINPDELCLKVRSVLAVVEHARQSGQQFSAEDASAQTQKMEAVGMLAGGIAHDFNNILAVILSFAGFASEGLAVSDKRYGDLNEVIKAANRAARLTRQLLTVTSQQPSELEPTDLNERLGQLSNLISTAAGPEVSVTVAQGVAPAIVELDPVQFDQVILNLVVNAREAMPQGGSVRISIDSDADHRDREKRSVRLVVSDSGVGMDRRTQQQIFQPFFSTKGKGKGLGLATCFGIVEACGGSIRVSSSPGRGSTFTIEFPLSVHVPAKAPRSAPFEPQGAGENVLIAEDEATLLQALVRVFEGAGYRVHAAADGEAAKRIIDQLGPKLDAVVTDVIMPGMSGDQVALHAVRVAPDAAIFLTSGYLDGARNDGEFPILWKPIPPREIARTVAQALAERRNGGQDTSSSASSPTAILVVEDDEAAQQALSRILSAANFAPRLAGTLLEAREILAGHPEIEVLLCDLSLPDGSGAQLLEWIQTARPELCDRTFVLTGSAGAASSRQLVAGKAFPVLSKLMPPPQLLKVLQGVRLQTEEGPHSRRSSGAMRVAPKLDPAVQREAILIVTEDETLSRAAARMLRTAGFDVATAPTRSAAVGLAASREFSALVLDEVMAVAAEGETSARELQLPTVVLIASPTPSASVKAARRQATEYLMKPFSAEALRAVTRRAIDSERAARIRRQLLAAHHGGDDFQADLAGTARSFDSALQRIEMAFQPIVRAADGSVFGFEALLRCSEPVFSSPPRLLAASQVLGRQHDLGRVIRLAVAKTLREHPERDEVIFVNVDPSELGDELLTEASDPLLPFARRVVIEISERAVLVNTDSSLEKRLSRLRERGYRLALDDLGEGYAGLSSLASVLPDIVKLDNSLVHDIHRSALKRDIVVSVLQAARRSGIIVVAEGVETPGERQELSALGCDLMQGYLFAKPGPAFPVPVQPR